MLLLFLAILIIFILVVWLVALTVDKKNLKKNLTETRRQLERMQKDVETYRLLADNLNENIFILDLETMQHTYVSPSVARTHGYTPAEIMSLPLEKLMPPGSVEKALQIIAREMERDNQSGLDPDRHIRFEMEHYHKDGSIIWLETTVKPLRDASGRPVSVLGVARDVTERKKAEEALRQSERLYRLLADNITEIIAIIDIKTLKHLYVSPSVEKIRGFTVAEIMQQSFDEILAPTSYQVAMQTINEELEKESLPGIDPSRSIKIELEQLHKDGSTVWTEAVATFLRDEAGRPVSILTTSREITEQKKTADALRQSEEKYRMLAENISEVIFILDIQSLRFVYVTPSAQQLTGFSAEEISTMPLDKIITPESFARTVRQINEELDRDPGTDIDPDRFNTLELEVYRRDGSTVWVENIARFLRDKDSHPVSILGVVRDLSERKKAEEALKQAKETAEAASRAKSEFLANMSHEIRTPMYGIIGMSELLLDTALNEEQLDYTETVKTSAENLLSIINEVLDYSKIEANMLSLEMIEFDLENLCREVHDTILARARRKELDYNLLIKEDVPRMVTGDPVRLRQILVNLCDNAVKFTHQGSVTTTVSLEQHTVDCATILFEVADTGIGIPPEEHERIFESFSQVDASTTRRYGGTGLGLAISRQLVSMLGGEITVNSRPGKGATFSFQIVFKENTTAGRRIRSS